MDPNATYQIMLDESLPIEDRAEAARNLRNWLNNGGYLPRTGQVFGGNTAARFYVEQQIDQVHKTFRDHLAAVEAEA